MRADWLLVIHLIQLFRLGVVICNSSQGAGRRLVADAAWRDAPPGGRAPQSIDCLLTDEFLPNACRKELEGPAGASKHPFRNQVRQTCLPRSVCAGEHKGVLPACYRGGVIDSSIRRVFRKSSKWSTVGAIVALLGEQQINPTDRPLNTLRFAEWHPTSFANGSSSVGVQVIDDVRHHSLRAVNRTDRCQFLRSGNTCAQPSERTTRVASINSGRRMRIPSTAKSRSTAEAMRAIHTRSMRANPSATAAFLT